MMTDFSIILFEKYFNYKFKIPLSLILKVIIFVVVIEGFLIQIVFNIKLYPVNTVCNMVCKSTQRLSNWKNIPIS